MSYVSGGTLFIDDTQSANVAGTYDDQTYSAAYVSSGGNLSGGTISENDSVSVEDAGSITNVTINSGSISGSDYSLNGDITETGGTITGGYLTSNSTIYGSDNAYLLDVTYQSGSVVRAENGTDYSTVFISNGTIDEGAAIFGGRDLGQNAQFEGTITNDGIISGGQENTGAVINVGSTGSMAGTFIHGRINATSGAHLSGLTIGNDTNSSGENSGGEVGTIVASGAELSGKFTNYGHVSGGNLTAGGILDNSYGGIAQGIVTQSGGTIIATNGGIISGGVIQSGATALVSAAGIYDNNNIDSGGVVSMSLADDNPGVIKGIFTNDGTLIGGTQDHDSVITLQSGGVISSTALMGQVHAESGAILSGVTLTNDGGGNYGYVSGPSVDVFGENTNYGQLNNATLHSGATLYTGERGDTENLTVESGATATIGSSGGIQSATVQSGGVIEVQSGGTLDSATLTSGGTIEVQSGGALTGTQHVASGGTMILNGDAGNGIISLDGDGASLIINGTEMPMNVISSWSENDKIDLTGIPGDSIKEVTRENDVLTLTTKDGNTYSLNIPGVQDKGYTLETDPNGQLVYTTCFAEGTLIATPSGETAVEALTQGDLVNTPKGAMPVKWAGYRSITVADQKVPEENWLIRIKAGALAENVPTRDLLITQEHCMIFEGKMVPARMLVNGVSVIIDRTINSYTYYHIELDTHEALWAEGALTESYLDTGNRDQFENTTVTSLFPNRHAEGSASLPLDTSRGFVEPIHAAILARTGATAPTLRNVTHDADLHLITASGTVVRPSRVNGTQHVFMLPADTTDVTIASRASRPVDVVGPFLDDRRTLGVLIGQISIFGNYGQTTLTSHLNDATLSGWNNIEPSANRWTNGNASLHISAKGSTTQQILTLEVQAQGPYLMEEDLRATA